MMKRSDDWSAIDELSKHRRLYLYTCAAAVLCSLIISFSIPKQYVSRIIVTPETKFLELQVGAQGGRLSKFLNESSVWTETGPDIYIEILHTIDFREKVKKLRVRTSDGKFAGTYEDYLKTEMDYPWYYNLFSNHTIDDIVDDNVRYSLNRGNATLTLQVSSCDPMLSAMMPEMLKQLLHEKITERYHMRYLNIAKDFEDNLKDAQAVYKEKMKEYSDFRDSHEGVKDKTYMTVQTALQAEMRRAYAQCEKFRELKERCEMLAVKGDVYLTTLVNPIVAREATNPHYIANALLWLFYSLVFTTLFILYRKKYRLLKGKEDNA